MRAWWCVAAAAVLPAMGVLALVGAAAPPGSEPVLERCLVSLVDERDVPAREPGELVEVLVREGQAVQKGMPIGRLNDAPARTELDKAKAELAYAEAKAANDVAIRFAIKGEEVAKAEFEKNEQTNRESAGTVPEMEMLKLKLECDKAGLQIEQAKIDQGLEKLTVVVKQVAVEAAEVALERRLIRSPLDGEVERIDKHVGEWMQAGDRLAHVVRRDVCRVESFIKAAEWDPDEIMGREVTVVVSLERGRRETFQGRIVFVSSEDKTEGEYRVYAEVANRRDPTPPAGGEGSWLLRAGQKATMTIHTTRPPAQP